MPSRSASAETVYRHALDSVTAAGLDPNDVKVLPVDYKRALEVMKQEKERMAREVAEVGNG